jgi:hypothetical protein
MRSFIFVFFSVLDSYGHGNTFSGFHRRRRIFCLAELPIASQEDCAMKEVLPPYSCTFYKFPSACCCVNELLWFYTSSDLYRWISTAHGRNSVRRTSLVGGFLQHCRTAAYESGAWGILKPFPKRKF